MIGNEVNTAEVSTTEGITVDYDSLWKDLIQEFFEDFLLLLAPKLHSEVDFSKGYEFLEQELRQLFPDSELHGVRTDKLAKVFLKNGEEKWILIHIEVQGYAEKDFAERMFKYFYRAYDRYRKNIYAIAIFTDDRKHFKPEKYEYEFFKTKLTYEYDTYKIIEQDERELAYSDNPFATAVLAGKYAIQSKQNHDLALKFKLRLARLLLEKKWSRKRLERLFIFIDGIVALPTSYEELFERELKKLTGKEDPDMGLTWDKSNLAKMYIEKGEIRGLAKGKAEGKAEGRAEILMKLLTLKFNNVPEYYETRLMKLDKDELDTIVEKILTIENITELEKYLE